MSEPLYDVNYAIWMNSAGITPSGNPPTIRGTLKDILARIQANQVVNPVTAVSNAGTIPITSAVNNFTNSSAATMTITLATTGAVDGQISEVRVFDFSAAAETITWVNTENSTVTAPVTSNGSTTLPLSTWFQFNGATSKWRTTQKA